MSNNARRLYDLEESAKLLGFSPQDDYDVFAEAWVDTAVPKPLDTAVPKPLELPMPLTGNYTSNHSWIDQAPEYLG